MTRASARISCCRRYFSTVYLGSRKRDAVECDALRARPNSPRRIAVRGGHMRAFAAIARIASSCSPRSCAAAPAPASRLGYAATLPRRCVRVALDKARMQIANAEQKISGPASRDRGRSMASSTAPSTTRAVRPHFSGQPPVGQLSARCEDSPFDAERPGGSPRPSQTVYSARSSPGSVLRAIRKKTRRIVPRPRPASRCG